MAAYAVIDKNRDQIHFFGFHPDFLLLFRSNLQMLRISSVWHIVLE